MAEPRKYRNPPIEEALCEIYFAPGPEWDPTMPGLIYQRLKDDYNQKPRLEPFIETRLEHGGDDQSPILTHRKTGHQFLFYGDEGRRIVKIGPNRLSIHMLRPYLGWEKFQPQIRQALETYAQEAKPEGITQIGLRYINKITIQGREIHLPSYFTMPPQSLPIEQPTRVCSFLDRREAVLAGEPIHILVTFADVNEAETAPASASFLLDLDIIRRQDGSPVSLKDFWDVLEDLKVRHRRVFEGLITDETRRLFDAE